MLDCSHRTASLLPWFSPFPAGFANRLLKFSPNLLMADKVNTFFYVLLTVHLSISLDRDQLDTHFLYFYFTGSPLQSSTCFEHYTHHQEVNCTDAASGIVFSVSGLLVHRLREKEFSLNLCTGRPLTERTIPHAASVQLTSL